MGNLLSHKFASSGIVEVYILTVHSGQWCSMAAGAVGAVGVDAVIGIASY